MTTNTTTASCPSPSPSSTSLSSPMMLLSQFFYMIGLVTDKDNTSTFFPFKSMIDDEVLSK